MQLPLVPGIQVHVSMAPASCPPAGMHRGGINSLLQDWHMDAAQHLPRGKDAGVRDRLEGQQKPAGVDSKLGRRKHVGSAGRTSSPKRRDAAPGMHAAPHRLCL